MKNFFVSKRGMIMAAAAATLLAVPFTASEITSRKIGSVKNLNSGSNTCFTRVGQTFTALMIGDFGSAYLSKDFIATTGECFSQLNKSFDGVFASSFTEAKKPLNKLTSDLFWFHEKTEKLAEMAGNGDIELSSSSTILDKYSSLESLNIAFQEKIGTKAESLETWRNVWSGLSIVGALSISLFALLIGRSRQKEKEIFEQFNQEASKLLEESPDLDKLILKSGRLMESLFNKIQAPYCHELYTHVQSDILERGKSSLSVISEKNAESAQATPVRFPDSEEEEEICEFGSAARALMDRMNDKVFTHGILLDQNLDEDFAVKGNSESVEQLLYNLLSFSLESSLRREGPRKLSVKSKALGGIAYFKTRVSGYLLNPSEMELFNGGSPAEESNVNLMLLKEIAADMGVSITAKNILNGGSGFTGAEIEVVFKRLRKRAQTPAQDKKTTVMKGSKKEILKALRS